MKSATAVHLRPLFYRVLLPSRFARHLPPRGRLIKPNLSGIDSASSYIFTGHPHPSCKQDTFSSLEKATVAATSWEQTVHLRNLTAAGGEPLPYYGREASHGIFVTQPRREPRRCALRNATNEKLPCRLFFEVLYEPPPYGWTGYPRPVAFSPSSPYGWIG